MAAAAGSVTTEFLCQTEPGSMVSPTCNVIPRKAPSTSHSSSPRLSALGIGKCVPRFIERDVPTAFQGITLQVTDAVDPRSVRQRNSVVTLASAGPGRLLLKDATFEHEDGRGAGGSKRDDRIVLPDGTWINGVSHLLCNSLKGSRHIPFNEARNALANSKIT